MTLQHDAVADLFGLAGTFPRPGWVVLDAARDHRFTGELVFDTAPAAHVYLERGVIYLAERASDPSLGARLVDAGALSAVQLERGAVRIGEIEHLGRLFERVPLLDRHTVLVTAEIMTEECLGWLAVQRVADVTSAPYRHHESGMHQWSRGSARPDLVPGDPLPAPTPDEAPVLAVPAPLDRSIGDRTEEFLDGLIEWDEPSWLDGSELERALVEPRADDDLDADLRPDERSGFRHRRVVDGDRPHRRHADRRRRVDRLGRPARARRPAGRRPAPAPEVAPPAPHRAGRPVRARLAVGRGRRGVRRRRVGRRPGPRPRRRPDRCDGSTVAPGPTGRRPSRRHPSTAVRSTVTRRRRTTTRPTRSCSRSGAPWPRSMSARSQRGSGSSTPTAISAPGRAVPKAATTRSASRRPVGSRCGRVATIGRAAPSPGRSSTSRSPSPPPPSRFRRVPPRSTPSNGPARCGG
jgi:hypothetical protein